jgi:hypothetical protein
MDNYLVLSLCRQDPSLLNIGDRFYIPQKSQIPNSGIAGSNYTWRYSLLYAASSVVPSPRAIIETAVAYREGLNIATVSNRQGNVKIE